jgi:predicted porin
MMQTLTPTRPVPGTLVLGALLGALALPASAQSMLTAYGILDLSIERVDGTADLTRLSSGNLSGSRLGFKGTEDLGVGVKAKFALESAVRADTGANGGGSDRFWDRQAWVGLGSDSLGEMRLGRTDSSLALITDMIGTQAYDDLTIVGTRGANSYRRMDNTITYLIPAVVPGLSAQLQYALAASGFSPTTGALAGTPAGAETSADDAGKVWSANLLYASGPFVGALGYLDSTDENRLAAGKQRARAAMGLASWDFGVLKLTAYHNTETSFGPDRLSTWGGKLAVPVGPSLVLTGGVSHTAGTTITDNDEDAVWIYSLKAVYALSRRTSLYAWYAYVDNDTAANKGIVTTAAGSSGQGLALGVRHLF